MSPDKKEEIKKLKLPKVIEAIQVVMLQILAGSISACCLLYWSKGEEIVTKAWGAPAYSIIFATFFMAGVISGFAAGTKGVQLLIHLIRVTKNIKDDE